MKDEVALGLRLRESRRSRLRACSWGLNLALVFVNGPFLRFPLVREKRVTIASILVLKPEIVSWIGNSWSRLQDLRISWISWTVFRSKAIPLWWLPMVCSSCWNIVIVVSLWLRGKSLQTTIHYNLLNPEGFTWGQLLKRTSLYFWVRNCQVIGRNNPVLYVEF